MRPFISSPSGRDEGGWIRAFSARDAEDGCWVEYPPRTDAADEGAARENAKRKGSTAQRALVELAGRFSPGPYLPPQMALQIGSANDQSSHHPKEHNNVNHTPVQCKHLIPRPGCICSVCADTACPQ